jgi:oligopeptide/dipeptide ABC transporter ATP-binding protein
MIGMVEPDTGSLKTTGPLAAGVGRRVLEVDDLTVRIPTREGDVHAVAGVTFTVDAGEVLGVVGESGSGKSVTGLAIMGLLPRRATVEGSIRFNGIELLGLDDRVMRHHRGRDIAMIFQDPMTALNPVFTVGDQIVEMICQHQEIDRREARREALDLMDMVGIPEPRRRFDQYPHEFSGGMRQRVVIAIATANRPQLVIADEPTTALDVTIQARILELIAELQERLETSVLYISHDLSLVKEICDRVAVMYAGRIVETGTTEEIFSNPAHPYTRGLMAAVPSATHQRGKLAAIEGTVPELVDPPPSCRFNTRCPYAVGICRTVDPTDVDLGESHRVACFIYDTSLDSSVRPSRERRTS